MADDLAAVLEEIHERYRRSFTALRGNVAHEESADDVPHLLAAVEAALELHQPKPIYGLAADSNGKSLCGHSADYDGDAHFEGDDGYWYCSDKRTDSRCSSCADEEVADLWEEWPCPTVKAITRVLAGQ